MIAWILTSLAGFSVLLNLWQWYAAKRFRFHKKPGDFAPPLSILRPLKGSDVETGRCLESWFVQEYPAETELLFGVASETDPVCEVVRQLMAKYPEIRAELLICKPILGANGKVSSLCYLAKRAHYEHIVISDQDVRVSRNFLSLLVPALKHDTIGLVNCFYILANPRGLGMRLEAVAVNADFWSQVLQRNMVKPMDFALGAAMATTKKRLAEIGGFEALLDYLADDYQLGNRIAQAGGLLTIAPIPVECRSVPQKATEIWSHQLRWARTIRVCRPTPYFFSILSNSTLWPLMALAARPSFGVKLMVVALAVRVLTAQSNYARLTQQTAWIPALLAPLKDLLQTPIWFLAFLGNEIVWRDERFRVEKGGKLTRLV